MNSRSDQHEVSRSKTIRIVVNGPAGKGGKFSPGQGPHADEELRVLPPIEGAELALRRNGVLSSKAKRNMVECAGGLFRKLGLPKSEGQIYGLLYLSRKPMSLDDIVLSLGLSKGSASNGTRHLMSLGAIRHVWAPGERRDYFESVGDISSILRSIYQEFVRPRVGATGRTLSTILTELDDDRAQGTVTAEDAEFCRGRLESLLKLQKRLNHLAPLAEKLLL
jgi:HTH-type transcriptional regulator, glycine betaine synthesis regulator